MRDFDGLDIIEIFRHIPWFILVVMALSAVFFGIPGLLTVLVWVIGMVFAGWRVKVFNAGQREVNKIHWQEIPGYVCWSWLAPLIIWIDRCASL
jgi:hypothetical protein